MASSSSFRHPVGDASVAIRGARILGTQGPVRRDLVISDGRIVSFPDSGKANADLVLEVPDGLVAPGLIDLQVNGGFGYDFTSHPFSIWAVGRRLPEFGVTTFLPTIVSGTEETIASAQKTLAAGPPPGYVGAYPVGLHLEGPMINHAYAGAHDLRWLRVPNVNVAGRWLAANHVRMVTLAPELPGALDVIRVLRRNQVVVAAGHTGASPAEIEEAVACGLALGTHLFNAMAPFHHRAPGPVGALLANRGVAVTIIADGVHVHPTALQAAWQAKGPDRLILVSDAVALSGSGEGTAQLGETKVTISDSAVRTGDGVLAGSTIGLDQAVRNLVAFTGCEPHQAVGAASVNPARILTPGDPCTLEVGAPGDLTVFDADLSVRATLIGGRVVYLRDPHTRDHGDGTVLGVPPPASRSVW